MNSFAMLVKEELQGACYIEVQPGEHNGEFWKEESVYFTDDTFFLFSHSILVVKPSFSLWGKTVINRKNALIIADNLTTLATFLEKSPSLEEVKEKLGFVQSEEETQFADLLQGANYTEHIDVLRTFAEWLKLQTLKHSHLTILGI